MNHPTYETLINYIEGHLPEPDRAQIDGHLSGPCQQCGDQVARLRIILDAMAADRAAAPSPDVLSRAVALYQKHSAATSRSPLRVLADLLFDSRSQLSPAAARGAAHARQMLFATQQVDIDLNITLEQKEHNLVGQILGREGSAEHPPAFVSLQGEGGAWLQGAEVDSLGQFAFRQVPSGIYELVADFGGEEVAITGLELGND